MAFPQQYIMVPEDFVFDPLTGTITWQSIQIAGPGGDSLWTDTAGVVSLTDPTDSLGINGNSRLGATSPLVNPDAGNDTFSLFAQVELADFGANKALLFTYTSAPHVVRPMTSATPGDAGVPLTIRSGSGAPAGGGSPGGDSGTLLLFGSVGGLSDGVDVAGNGGESRIVGGNGGGGSGAVDAGNGGPIGIFGGDAGSPAIGVHTGGSVFVDTGVGINGGANGVIDLGTARAEQVLLGRSGGLTNNTYVRGTLRVDEASLFAADITHEANVIMSGDHEYLPSVDDDGNIGNATFRFSLVRAVVITAGDIGFDDAGCAVCGRAFAVDDDLVMRVRKVEHDGHRPVAMTVPIHADCR